MTNTTGGTTPAGWYPVTPGSAQLRWWDGAAWTDHVHDQAVQQQIGGGIPKSPEGTNPNTVWIWILACLPVVSLASLAVFNVKRYLSEIENAGVTGASDPTFALRAMEDSGYFAIIGFSFLFYVLTVLFAALDWRALKARGVVKPFHWALSFIPSYGYLIYMIGRFVVVKRRTGTGLTPLWVWIAVYVIVVIVAVIWVFSQVAGFAGDFSSLPNS